jgi:hypothetical protein
MLRTADGSRDTISLVGMRVRIWPHVTPLAMAVSFAHAVGGMAVSTAIVHSDIVVRFHHGGSGWLVMTRHAGPLAQT